MQEPFPVIEVRGREQAAVSGEPFDTPRTVAPGAVVFPERRIRSTEAVQRFLHDVEREIVRVHFQGKDHDVDVEEEIQIDVRDRECDRLRLRAGQGHAHGGDVAASIDADR